MDSRAFVSDWHTGPVEAPRPTVVRNDEKPKASTPFTREKKEEPAGLLSDNFFG